MNIMYALTIYRHMYQKLIFLSTFNLVGALHDFPTIGNVARYYYKEVSF
jgi:hypothetical protein